MKKLIAILLLTLTATTAMAQHHGHGGGYYRGGGYRGGWIAPALIGGAIGYGLTRNYYEPYYAPPPVYYAPQPQVYYSQPPVYVQQPQATNCQRVIIQNEQGQTIREETRCN